MTKTVLDQERKIKGVVQKEECECMKSKDDVKMKTTKEVNEDENHCNEDENY